MIIVRHFFFLFLSFLHVNADLRLVLGRAIEHILIHVAAGMGGHKFHDALIEFVLILDAGEQLDTERNKLSPFHSTIIAGDHTLY